jgi:hypothetical protein
VIACKDTRLIAAELKVASAMPRPEQQAWLDALDLAGVEVYVWRPTQWPEIEQVLTGQLQIATQVAISGGAA